MLNRSSKGGPEDAEATNKPTSDTNSINNTQNPTPSYSAATAASSSSLSTSTVSGDDAVRLERLRGLRDQLANRVYRLEMDELLNSNPENDNTRASNSDEISSVIIPSQTQSPTRASRQISVSTSSRPVAIPVRQQVQVLAPPFNLNAARNLLRDRMDEREISARMETDRETNSQGRHHARVGTRRSADSRRRTAVGNGGESLITVDEFLRESRAPARDHDGAGPASSSPQRSTSLPRVRASELRAERRSLRPRTDTNPIFSPSLNTRLDATHREERLSLSPDATSPHTAPWWNVGSTPAGGQHAAPLSQETFDTFINHIRNIGHLQDMMLASIRSSNIVTATDSAGHGGNTVVTASSSAQSNSIGSLDPTVGPTASVPRAAVPTTAMSTATATSPTNPGPSWNAAEARLRAMQTRIDILASEFSLLRSSWALSHNESQSYERSLRRLQEYLPSGRRNERARRSNRGEVSLLYDDLHADTASREAESFPRNPWSGDSDVEINRERMRMATAWALGREGLTRTESSRGTDVTGGNGEGRPNAAVATPPLMGSSTPFSLAQRELHKDLLAAKMEELTLQGMR